MPRKSRIAYRFSALQGSCAAQGYSQRKLPGFPPFRVYNQAQQTNSAMTRRYRSIFTAAIAAAVSALPAAEITQKAAKEAAADSRPAAPTTESIIKKAEELASKAGTVSADGFARVSGSAFNSADQQVIRGFITDIRSRLSAVTGVDFPLSEYRVWIIGEKGDTLSSSAYNIALVPGALKFPNMATIRINVENPENMDSRELADAVSEALFMLKIYLAGRAGGKTPNLSEVRRLPQWFTTGLARAMDPDRRQRYAEETLKLWESGHLPPAWELAAPNSVYASAYPCVAAQLAAFWLQFPDPAARLDRICSLIAGGDSWSSSVFDSTSSGKGSAYLFDRAFDEWMCGRRFAILTTGVTYPDFILRTLRRMYVSPGFDGTPDLNGNLKYRPLPVNKWAEFSGSGWARQTAAAKIEFIGISSAGRGDKFREAAAMFSELFAKWAEGSDRDSLRAMWQKAENAMFQSTELTRSDAGAAKAQNTEK